MDGGERWMDGWRVELHIVLSSKVKFHEPYIHLCRCQAVTNISPKKRS